MSIFGEVMALGACGGVGGDDFSMSLESQPVLKKVKVWYAEGVIGKVQVAVTDKEHPEEHWLEPWGKAGWRKTYELAEIDFQGYELIRVEGTYDEVVYNRKTYVVVTSIMFVTKNKDAKPVLNGHPSGRHFTLSAGEPGKILGFFGRSGNILDAIGVYAFRPQYLDQDLTLKLGPTGSVGSLDYEMVLWGSPRMTKIKVWYAEDVIGKIQVAVKSPGIGRASKELWLDAWGRGQGRTYKVAQMDFEKFFVKKLEGTYNIIEGNEVITSLSFTTDENPWEPKTFGTPSGKKFTYEAGKYGRIVGFFGRAGDCIEAIGVYAYQPKESQKANS